LKKLIFASGNKGKTREVKDLFNNTGLEIISLLDLPDYPDVIEDGDTFEANAKKKAVEIFEKYKLPVIADDSGLCVDQLNGAPGVYSARYAGEGCSYEDNNRKLLKELSNFTQPHMAKFVCCAVYYDEANYLYTIGELPGEIIKELRGDKGFGYDPVFKPEFMEKTLAELDLDEKNKLSHRARAFNQLKELMIKRVL